MPTVDRFEVSDVVIESSRGVIDSTDMSVLGEIADLYLSKRLSASGAQDRVMAEFSSSPEKTIAVLVILSEMTGRFIYDADSAPDFINNPEREKRPGYIYCASNPSLTGLIKVGMTTKEPQDRLEQLSKSTSIPDDFVLEWCIPTDDTYAKEIAAHEMLSDYWHSKEFFRIFPNEALRIVESENVKTR